jgi:hypothetical protein
MRTAILVATSFGVSALALAAPPVNTSYVVVRITEMDRSEDLQAMSSEEFRELQSDLRKENLLFSRAVQKAAEEWGRDESKKGKFFPRTAVAPRKAEQVGQPYPDQEKAQRKVDAVVDGQQKREGRKAQLEMARERERLRQRGMRGRYVKPPTDPRREAREREKEQILTEAIALVRTHLDALKAQVAAQPSAGAQGGQ